MNAKVGELFQNKEFVDKLYPMSFEEVKQEIEANGGEITMDELKEIAEEAHRLNAQTLENGGELSEEDLDDVTGGAGFLKTFARCLAGSAAGWAIGGPAGAFAGAMIMGITTK